MAKDKKLSIPAMAVKNLKARKSRTGFMMLFVVLMSATFFFSTILMNNLELGITNTTEKMGADLIVVPKEGTEDIRESLFAGEPCSLFFGRYWEEIVRNVEGVESVSPQLYIATMAATCCDAPVQIIAIDPATDFVIKPWLQGDNELDLKEGEIVVGYNVVGDVGERLTFYGVDFEIATRLEKTGMGYDNSVFMTYDTVHRFENSETIPDTLPMGKIKSTVSMLMVDVEEEMEGMTAARLQIDIQEAGPAEDGIYACTSADLMSGIASQVSKLSGYGSVLTYIMVVSTALALISIFTITINERKYEFGILYTLGARKQQITNIILSEALIISMAGGTIGVLLAYYLVSTFDNIISTKLDIPFLDISMKQVLPVAGICIIIAVLTGIVAAVYSAYRISKGEAYRLIRESE